MTRSPLAVPSSTACCRLTVRPESQDGFQFKVLLLLCMSARVAAAAVSRIWMLLLCCVSLSPRAVGGPLEALPLPQTRRCGFSALLFPLFAAIGALMLLGLCADDDPDAAP